MPAILAILALAAIVWGALVVRRTPVVVLVFGTLVVGYVLGHSFWNAHLGPLPLTLDRLLLAAVVAAFAVKQWRRQTTPTPWGVVDWALGLLLVWLTVSCYVSQPGEGVRLPTSPWFRLLASFWIPATLYLAVRGERLDASGVRWLLGALVALGVYLGVTALLETAGVWSLVFPRYIADPELGLHYGRARGPGLNSVSLGVYLSVCAGAAWLMIPRSPRWAQACLLAAVGLMASGVFLTATRSTWIGLAAGGGLVVLLQIPRAWRLTATLGSAVLMGLVLTVGWSAIVNLEREDSGGVSAHSVQQREAFAYVSAQMVRDYPLVGVGFGRFYDKKLPYLSDRRQSFELESLRELHHHNTFLSLLTETGMLGLALYLSVLAGALVAAWRLVHSPLASDAERTLGYLLVATVAIYAPSALFHDLSLVHSDQWLVFVITGLGVGAERRLALRTASASARSALPQATATARPTGAAI
ncbi:O-Antigen ligase [Pseudobythopirellula maris]|uniref:O-Antigen ligase n=1 Tax=Pseudobythopirellula maris TaxID=2527991 RepID=A0A5C5ZQZ3_9BACT|nr:O-antigen ligase family protein [Pseudobythopirellula maris]TWT89700.1 O-Antigen ligase [Pseudobythopirellula maris]